MKHQAQRRAALMLSVLLAAVVPAQAGTITLADVSQAFVDGQSSRRAVEFRLRSIAQSGSVPVSTVTSPTQSGAQSSSSNAAPNGTQSTTTSTGDGSASLIDTAQQPSGTVETVDLGDVTGTVCDCGPFDVVETPRGGFPKWPLIALAGIPLAFIPGGNDETPPGPTPTPTPPPPAVPEPATILLFGSSLMALGAGARRRRARKQFDGKATVAIAEEV